MKLKPGILLGIPVLAFMGWFIWTEIIAYQDFQTWQAELPGRAQVLSPEAVSQYRAGDVADFPGFIYRLTPRDEAQRIREEQLWKTIRAERLEFSRNELDSVSQIWYDRLAIHESQYLDMPWEWWAMNLFNPQTGIQIRLPQMLVNQHYIGEVEDCEGYIYRLRELPKRLEEAIIETERVAASGWVMDSLTLKRAVTQLRTWAATPAKEQSMYRSFGTRITRLDPTVINEYQSVDYLIEAAKTLEESVAPTLLDVANRLEQLPARAPGMQRLPSDLYNAWLNVLAGREVVPETWFAEDSVVAMSFPTNDLESGEGIDPVAVLEEIRASTAGILPVYPADEIRLRFQHDLMPGDRPVVLAGTRDGAVFPRVILCDTTFTRSTVLDIYQYALPGAAWIEQLWVESGENVVGSIMDQRAKWTGWGLAALDLLQIKLLWFSRDTTLLTEYNSRIREAEWRARLDLRVNGQLFDPTQEDHWPVGAEALPESWRQQQLESVLAQPGMAVATWIWYQTWRNTLKDCDWDVACVLSGVK